MDYGQLYMCFLTLLAPLSYLLSRKVIVCLSGVLIANSRLYSKACCLSLGLWTYSLHLRNVRCRAVLTDVTHTHTHTMQIEHKLVGTFLNFCSDVVVINSLNISLICAHVSLEGLHLRRGCII